MIHKDACWIVFFIIVIAVFCLKTISIKETFKTADKLHELIEDCLSNLNLNDMDKILEESHHTMIFNSDFSKIYLDSFEKLKNVDGNKPTSQQLQFVKIMKQDIIKSSTLELYDTVKVVTISKGENENFCVFKYIFT